MYTQNTRNKQIIFTQSSHNIHAIYTQNTHIHTRFAVTARMSSIRVVIPCIKVHHTVPQSEQEYYTHSVQTNINLGTRCGNETDHIQHCHDSLQQLLVTTMANWTPTSDEIAHSIPGDEISSPRNWKNPKLHVLVPVPVSHTLAFIPITLRTFRMVDHHAVRVHSLPHSNANRSWP